MEVLTNKSEELRTTILFQVEKTLAEYKTAIADIPDIDW